MDVTKGGDCSTHTCPALVFSPKLINEAVLANGVHTKFHFQDFSQRWFEGSAMWI